MRCHTTWNKPVRCKHFWPGLRSMSGQRNGFHCAQVGKLQLDGLRAQQGVARGTVVRSGASRGSVAPCSLFGRSAAGGAALGGRARGLRRSWRRSPVHQQGLVRGSLLRASRPEHSARPRRSSACIRSTSSRQNRFCWLISRRRKTVAPRRALNKTGSSLSLKALRWRRLERSAPPVSGHLTETTRRPRSSGRRSPRRRIGLR